MSLVTDEAIPVVFLPECSSLSGDPVELFSSEAFPGVDYILQGMPGYWLKEYMDMVGHDNEGSQAVALIIKVTERIGDSMGA